MRVMLEPPSSRRSSRLGSRELETGFTILELLIFLMLITVTAAFSIWAYFARPEVTLENAAELLARDLRTAQNRASLLHGPVSLVFHDDGDGYRIVDGVDVVPHPVKRRDRIDRRYSRDATFEGVKILPIGLAMDGRVIFGEVEGEIPAGRIALCYGDHTRSVEIEPGTGKVVLTGH